MSVEPVVDVPAQDQRSLQQRQVTSLGLGARAGDGGGVHPDRRRPPGISRPIERLGLAAGEPFGPLGLGRRLGTEPLAGRGPFEHPLGVGRGGADHVRLGALACGDRGTAGGLILTRR